ncbi:MAG: tetratricopeptide repeat protein [Bdellovibrionales bacterium]
MMNITRNIILVGSAMLFAGCATAPAEKTSAHLEALPAPAPSYEEKVGSMAVEQVKTACPADSKWEALEWKKISPYANACVKAKDWGKVEKMGNFLATHAHLTPWGPYYMSLAAEGRKDYPRAIWMLELALKKAPKEGIFHYELGRIHWELGDDADAVKHLKQASELSPSLTQAHWVMGQLAVQRHDFNEAETLFQKALKIDSKHLPSILGMATLTINNKDFARAEGYLTQAVALNPRSSKARLALAQVQAEHLKKYQDALHTYKQIKQMNADKKLDESVHINLDEKIQSLEKSLTQAAAKPKSGELTVRTPSGERKVE